MANSQRIERVALVSPYDVAQRGGVNEHIQQLAHHLRQRNIDVTILAPSSNPSLIGPDLIGLGSVVPVAVNGSVAQITLSPHVIEDVATLFGRTRFDVVHLHEPLAPLLPLSVLNASHSPNVGTFHASGERSLGYAASRKLLNWMAQRLNARIAVSNAAARFARRYFAGEYIVIPNGVDTVRFNIGVPSLPQWRDGRPTILFVGRFEEPRKGFDVLMHAFVQVQQAMPNARLLVVGTGDPQPYQKQAALLGVHSIEFVGGVSADELPRYYRSADVFCAPSTGQESFGIILAEAMSSGCAIVASDIEGYRQVVTHRQEGLLVPPAHVDALAAALIHVLSNDTVRTSLAAAGPATASRYAWHDVTERVVEVYEHVHWLGQTDSAKSLWLPPSISQQQQGSSSVTRQEPPSLPSQLPSQGATPMITKTFDARVRAFTQRVVGRVLGNSVVTPNMLTAVGLFLTLAVTLVVARGHLLLGGFLVLLTSAFDMLDGALARARGSHSAFGAFLDSTVDRYAEALIFLGLLLYYQYVPGSQFEIVMIYLTIVGSLMVSYTRARAESLGLVCNVGVLARPERVILLSLGLITGWMTFALAVLALFTNLTAIQRVYHVWAQTEGGQRRSAKQTKPQRRHWFASRDQSPS